MILGGYRLNGERKDINPELVGKIVTEEVARKVRMGWKCRSKFLMLPFETRMMIAEEVEDQEIAEIEYEFDEDEGLYEVTLTMMSGEVIELA